MIDKMIKEAKLSERVIKMVVNRKFGYLRKL